MLSLRHISIALLLFLPTLCIAAPQILDKTWYLTSLNSIPIEVMPHGADKPNIFLNANNSYAAYAGCNRIAGTFTIAGEQLSFAPNAAVTKMACPGRENLEQDFLAMLPKVKYYAAQEHTLSFTNAELSIIAVFDDTAP